MVVVRPTPCTHDHPPTTLSHEESGPDLVALESTEIADALAHDLGPS